MICCGKQNVPVAPWLEKSLKKAIEIAKTDSSIEIHVLYILTIPAQQLIVMVPYLEMRDNMVRYGEDILSHAQSALASIPNEFQCLQKEGVPAYVILDYAKNNNCDLIIMGSRGLSGIKEYLGSVSHTVVQQSLVPVLIVK